MNFLGSKIKNQEEDTNSYKKTLEDAIERLDLKLKVEYDILNAIDSLILALEAENVRIHKDLKKLNDEKDNFSTNAMKRSFQEIKYISDSDMLKKRIKFVADTLRYEKRHELKVEGLISHFETNIKNMKNEIQRIS